MTINSKQLNYILDNTPATQNIMLVGKHGIGKSRILEDYFSKKGAKVVTLFLGQMSDPGDLIGLPEKNEKTGKTDFMLPYWFPVDGEPVVLFLDELNRARPEVLQTIMDLTLNRKLAGKSLPNGSRIISAVNNGNEYQLTDLDPALVSRFNIYEFAPTVEDWLLWALSSGIDDRIIAFISENPEYLDGDMSSPIDGLERTPDRRSWERTSAIIKNLEALSDDAKALVTGIIGNRATADFFRFVLKNDVPGAKQLLTHNFSEYEKQILEYSIPQLTQINVSLFRFIESHCFDEKDEMNIAKNLFKYFDFLGKNGKSEIQSHFIGLCNANSYPETLVFISTKVPELYKNIMTFVEKL